MKAAESFRAREVYRYFQPGNESVSLDDHEVLPTTLSSDRTTFGDAIPRKTNFNTQQSFSDTALTAFTQLIALRLKCQRAIVSLIDHENEYFLAESTSTLSLLDGDGLTQNVSVSISGTRVPRGLSLCENTLRLVPNQQAAAEMTPVCFVSDLRLDENLKRLECVEREPYLRFYCGVALTNKKGVNIGCVYVVDDRPRSNFSLEQAQFLTTMAATVMDHLENIRAKEDVVRVTRMSQALHAFIEGDGTMDGDWQRLKKYNLPAGEVGFHWESNKQDGSGHYVNGKEELGAGASPATGATLNLPLSEFINLSFDQGQSPLQHTTSNHDARFNFNNSPWSSSSGIPQVLPSKSVYEGIDARATETLTGGRDTEFSSSGFLNLLHTTFSRASNLVREGMEVDGAVYFDAPFRFYQGRSTLETDPRAQKEKTSESSDESDIDGPLDIRPGPHPISRPPIFDQSKHTARDTRKHKTHTSMGLKSEILGYSTQGSSSWNNQSAEISTQFTSIDQSLLTSLVKRYPKGELFDFDEDGPIEPPPDLLVTERSQITIAAVAIEEKRARRRAREHAEVRRLLVAFPRARQIFFVPLYDSTSGCFIGSFAWSTSATRIFSIENHLSYLIAFGHSVMSEVSRLNTLSADRTKGDFISNVSHELRSPLHGILASVEFLADTSLDGFQRNLVDTVDMCGRTLLDTIEHVLDFSKIKKFGHEAMQPLGVVADLDVSAVIEEVLEGAYAGFEFNGLSSQGLADATKSRTRDAAFTVGRTTSPSDKLQHVLSNDLLTVILDIEFRDQWKFLTVPGTWRRLTMNLFGNALKYTKSGYIKIKLEARPIPSTDVKGDGIDMTMVTLTVSDSGKGISPEFLKSKLFMPFTQEDVTGPGIGLGMSIVKQIVDLSGGRIDIQSELGKGTEVKLSLPLEDRLSEPEDLPAKLDLLHANEGPVEAVRRRAKGRTVQIHGFDASLGDSELRQSALASWKASIERYVTEWFNLSLVGEGQPADIVISDESAFSNSSSVAGSKFRSLLILCDNSARRDIYNTYRLERGQNVEFVNKPCGPHRCAKALLNCLDAEDVLEKAGKERQVSFSLSGPASAIVLIDGSMMTADQITGWRLIRSLQSSIGFSFKTIALNETPATFRNPRTPSKISRRPHIPTLDILEILSSDSETASNEISREGLSYDTANSSTSFSGQESPNLDLHSPSGLTSPRKPKMLLVEDNPVNMMLLATYMKKNGWDCEKATNGLVAVQTFQNRPEGFDVIFMDVSMPIMTGYESTRAIRAIEVERRAAYTAQQSTLCNTQSPLFSPLITTTHFLSASFPFNAPSTLLRTPEFLIETNAIDQHLNSPELRLSRPALVIALTGFSSQEDQETAFESGMDIFMTKPVQFREVGRILEGWMMSREREAMGASGVEHGVKIGGEMQGEHEELNKGGMRG